MKKFLIFAAVFLMTVGFAKSQTIGTNVYDASYSVFANFSNLFNTTAQTTTYMDITPWGLETDTVWCIAQLRDSLGAVTTGDSALVTVTGYVASDIATTSLGTFYARGSRVMFPFILGTKGFPFISVTAAGVVAGANQLSVYFIPKRLPKAFDRFTTALDKVLPDGKKNKRYP